MQQAGNRDQWIWCYAKADSIASQFTRVRSLHEATRRTLATFLADSGSTVLNPSISRENCHQESAPTDTDHIETGASAGKCYVSEGRKSSKPQSLELPQTSNRNRNLVFTTANCWFETRYTHVSWLANYKNDRQNTRKFDFKVKTPKSGGFSLFLHYISINMGLREKSLK